MDARMGSLLQMQYNLTILNYLDTVLITRQEKLKNYVKSVARMAAGGFQNTVEREVFHELHVQVVDELSDMVSPGYFNREWQVTIKTAAFSFDIYSIFY